MDFSSREYDDRLKRAKDLMEKKGLDALVVSSDVDFHYFTGATSLNQAFYGGRGGSAARPVFVLIPRDRQPVVMTHIALLDDTRRSSVTRDIRAYETSESVPLGGAPVKMIADVLTELGVSHGTLGIDTGLEQTLGFPCNDYLRLCSMLSKAKFVDTADLMWELRLVKSAEEINYIRKACEITAKARQACFDTIRAGMTEREVARIFGQKMMEYGADGPAFTLVETSRGAHTLYPSDKKLEKGDTLGLDGGCYVNLYTCDTERIATIGPPSGKQVEMHKFVSETSTKMIKGFRPGAKIAEVAAICWNEYKRMGLPINEAGRAGHGQGMLFTEPPSVSLLDKTVLKPGMVVSAEPGLITEHGTFIWEDLVAITEKGNEVLSGSETSELRIIR
jgi:Xaa-Pro aminopeptidase